LSSEADRPPKGDLRRNRGKAFGALLS